MNLSEEKKLFRQITEGDERAFEQIFHRYYQSLCVFAAGILKNDSAAEEIVQDLFVKIWEKKQQLEIQTSVKNYLLRSVKNQCINFIKHNKIKETHIKAVLSENDKNPDAEDNFLEIDLGEKIEESIRSLPEKRQEIFRLSREKGLKYREIAEKMDISVKTVETQMGLAIKHLREKLKDYRKIFMLFCHFTRK